MFQNVFSVCSILFPIQKAVTVSGVDFGAILTNAARFSADPEALAKWPQDEANKRSLVSYGFRIRILLVCSLDSKTEGSGSVCWMWFMLKRKTGTCLFSVFSKFPINQRIVYRD